MPQTADVIATGRLPTGQLPTGQLPTGQLRTGETGTGQIRTVQNVALLVVATYPALWFIGLGGLFWPLLCVVLVLRTRFAPSTPESTLLLLVSQLLTLSVPLGVIAFGLQPARVLSVLANITIWVSTAALLRLAAHDPTFRARLLRRVMGIAAFQGVVTLAAYLAYPASLGIPLLHRFASTPASGPAAFAADYLVYPDWLNGAAMRSIGVMANPTWAGAMGAIGVLIALRFRSELRYDGLLRVAAAAGGLVSMQLALSRSVEFGLAGALGLAALEYLRRRLRLGLTPWIAIALAIPLVAVTFASRVAGWVLSVNAERQGSSQTRGAIYAQTWELIQQLPVPLLGYGVKPKESGLVASVASHSTYLGLTFRAGAVATLLLLIAFALLARRTIADTNHLGLAMVAFIAVWCVFEDFDGGHLIPLGLVAAMAPGLKTVRISANSLRRSRNPAS